MPQSQTLPFEEFKVRLRAWLRSCWLRLGMCVTACHQDFPAAAAAGVWERSGGEAGVDGGLSLVCPVEKDGQKKMMSRIPRILSVRLQTSASLRKRKCIDSQIGRTWKNAALLAVGTDLYHQSGDQRINIWVVLGTETLNTFLPHHKKKKKPQVQLAVTPYHQQSPQNRPTNPL